MTKISKEILELEYILNQKSMKDIGKQYNISGGCVEYNLIKYGIRRRKNKNKNFHPKIINIEGNVQWVTKKINQIKMDMEQDIFINTYQNVVDYQYSQKYQG